MFDIFGNFMREMFPWNEEDFTKESFEVIKNGIKTTIDVYFNEKGYAVRSVVNSFEKENDELKQLEISLKKAVSEENYELAAELKKKRELLTSKN